MKYLALIAAIFLIVFLGWRVRSDEELVKTTKISQDLKGITEEEDVLKVDRGKLALTLKSVVADRQAYNESLVQGGVDSPEVQTAKSKLESDIKEAQNVREEVHNNVKALKVDLRKVHYEEADQLLASIQSDIQDLKDDEVKLKMDEEKVRAALEKMAQDVKIYMDAAAQYGKDSPQAWALKEQLAEDQKAVDALHDKVHQDLDQIKEDKSARRRNSRYLRHERTQRRH